MNYAYKFVAAFSLFAMINNSIGFIEEISTIAVAFFLAMVCCLLPIGAIVFVAVTLVMLNLFVLSLEAAFVGVLVFGLIFFLYFRFSPHEMILFTLTPLVCALGVFRAAG